MRSLIAIVALIAISGCANSIDKRTSAVEKIETELGSVETTELGRDIVAGIQRNDQLVKTELSPFSGFPLDHSIESIEWVDGFIQRNRDQPPGSMSSILGSFLGEAILTTYGGSWIEIGGVPAVRINENLIAFPFSKVEKQFINGSKDSILYYFNHVGSLVGRSQ